jgi:hypothetical protein
MKKILFILAIVSIMISGCSTSPKEPISQEEARYHAMLFLREEYPDTNFIITGVELKPSDNWEFKLKHNELTGGRGGLIFESYLCIDAFNGKTSGVTISSLC